MNSEFRCENCNKLLFKGKFIVIVIKCPRCGKLNTMRASEPPEKSGESNEIEVNP